MQGHSLLKWINASRRLPHYLLKMWCCHSPSPSPCFVSPDLPVLTLICCLVHIFHFSSSWTESLTCWNMLWNQRWSLGLLTIKICPLRTKLCFSHIFLKTLLMRCFFTFLLNCQVAEPAATHFSWNFNQLIITRNSSDYPTTWYALLSSFSYIEQFWNCKNCNKKENK